GQQPIRVIVADHEALVVLEGIVLPLTPEPEHPPVEKQAQTAEFHVQIRAVCFHPGHPTAHRAIRHVSDCHACSMKPVPVSLLCEPLTMIVTGYGGSDAAKTESAVARLDRGTCTVVSEGSNQSPLCVGGRTSIAASPTSTRLFRPFRNSRLPFTVSRPV